MSAWIQLQGSRGERELLSQPFLQLKPVIPVPECQEGNFVIPFPDLFHFLPNPKLWNLFFPHRCISHVREQNRNWRIGRDFSIWFFCHKQRSRSLPLVGMIVSYSLSWILAMSFFHSWILGIGLFSLSVLKGAHPCTSSSGQGGGKRVLEDFF